MKIKQMIQWQLMTNRFAFLLFYLIVAVLTACATITVSLTSGVTFSTTSIAYASIFMLVFGLASFSENLRFALANGVSRRTHYVSFLITSLVLCALTSIFCAAVDAITYSSLPAEMALIHSSLFDEFIFGFALFLFLTTLGYFISSGYYKMGKLAKTLVSVLVPILLILLIANTVLAEPGAAFWPMQQAFLALSTWMSASLLYSVCVWLILAAIFALLGWLVTHRIEIKPH